jgi:DNA-binding MarR family transcriptional regulator
VITNLEDDSITDEQLESLMAASRALVGLAVLSISELDVRMTLTQFRAVVLLRDAGTLKANQLASKLGTSASSVTRLCDLLEAEGLIRRIPNPQSRREVLIQASRKGERLVRRVMDRRRLDLRRILSTIDVADRSAVVSTMEQFAQRAADVHGIHLLAEWPVA